MTASVARHLENRLLAQLILVVSPAIIFARPLLRGEILFSNTDSLFAHYPNFIFGMRELLRGGLGLWNPYIFSGTDFSQSFHHHMLNPMWWILLPLGESHFFLGLNLLTFVFYVVCGLLVFHIAKIYLPTSSSLFAAMTFQISGYMWFTTMTMIAVPMTAASLFAIFLIHTFDRRSGFANLTLLTLALLPIVLIAHVAYVFAYLFVIGGSFVVRHVSVRGRLFKDTALCGLALALALAIGLYRLVPVMDFLLHEGAALRGGVRLASVLGDEGYLFLPGVIPSAIGYTLHDALKLGKPLDLLRHTQFHSLLYFGIVSLYFMVVALTGAAGKWARLAAVLFIGLGLAQAHTIQVITDIAAIPFYPMIHEIMLKIGSVFAFLLMMILLLRRQLPDYRLAHGAAGLGGLTCILFVSLICVGLFYAKSGMAVKSTGTEALIDIYSVKVLSLLILAGGFALYMAWPLADVARRKVVNLSLIALLLLFLAIVALIESTPYRHQYLLRYGYFYEAAGVAAALAVFFATRGLRYGAAVFSWRSHRVLIVSLLALSLAMILIDVPLGSGGRSRTAIMIGGALSSLKVLIVVVVLVELVTAWSAMPQHGAAFLVLLGLLAAGDLHSFNRTFAFTGAPPFVAQDEMYPAPYEETPTWLGRDRSGPGGGAPRKTIAIVEPAGSDSHLNAAWQRGGSESSAAVVPASDQATPIVRLTNRASDYAAIFHDLRVDVTSAYVTFGAWIRTMDPGVRLLVTTGTGARYSAFHSGAGEWEWLTVRTVVNRSQSLRLHVGIDGKGALDVAGLRLVEGRAVVPEVAMAGAQRESAMAPVRDYAAFRVNRPHLLTAHPYGETISNIPLIYGIRTFGGVDSDIRADLHKLVATFRTPDPSWIARFGMLSSMDDERFLSLVGARYSYTDKGVFVENRRALPRFAMFESYGVEASEDATFKVLAQPDFDFERSVILNAPPAVDVAPASRPGLRQQVDYKEVTSDRLNLHVRADRPQILFFGDSYSRHWRAFYNGAQLPVMKANGYFMAVAVPAGEGDVSFRFEPQPFLLLVRLALGLGAILLLSLVALGASSLRRMSRRRSVAAARSA